MAIYLRRNDLAQMMLFRQTVAYHGKQALNTDINPDWILIDFIFQSCGITHYTERHAPFLMVRMFFLQHSLRLQT